MRIYLTAIALLVAPTACATPPGPTGPNQVAARIEAPEIRLRRATLTAANDMKLLDVQICQSHRQPAPRRYVVTTEFLDAAGAKIDGQSSDIRISPRSPRLPPPCAYLGVRTRIEAASAVVTVRRK